MTDLLAAARTVKAAMEREATLAEPIEERLRRMNSMGVFGYADETGLHGGNEHPDRCKCQGDPFTLPEGADLRNGAAQADPYSDTTPHKHYGGRGRVGFPCARCPCKAYRPHDYPDDWRPEGWPEGQPVNHEGRP